jgi:hypothetical protein
VTFVPYDAALTCAPVRGPVLSSLKMKDGATGVNKEILKHSEDQGDSQTLSTGTRTGVMHDTYTGPDVH